MEVFGNEIQSKAGPSTGLVATEENAFSILCPGSYINNLEKEAVECLVTSHLQVVWCWHLVSLAS